MDEDTKSCYEQLDSATLRLVDKQGRTWELDVKPHI